MSLLRSAFPRPLSTLPSTTTRQFSSTPVQKTAKMTLIGRLASAPEILNAQSSGREYVRYSIAVRDTPKQDSSTSFYRVTNFDEKSPRRDVLTNCEKGTLVFVEADGRLRQVDAQEGQGSGPRVLDLVQRDFRILSRPRRAEGEDAPES